MPQEMAENPDTGPRFSRCRRANGKSRQTRHRDLFGRTEKARRSQVDSLSRDASRIPEESRKETSADKPPTYEGEWSGEPSAEPHVSAIVVQKNTFPCLGEVRFAHKGGGKFDKPDEDFSFQNNRVRVRGVDDVEVTSPVEWSKEGDELVGTHAHSKEVVARIRVIRTVARGRSYGALRRPASTR